MISLGLRTLFKKEVLRFMRVPGQTVLSPLITTTLYFVVFGFSLGGRLQEVQGIPYARFIVPGLVALGVVSNTFLNTASSLFIMKIQGTMVDLLVTPLSYAEILTGFVAAAVLRGAMVGGLMWLVAAFFTGFNVAYPLLAIFLFGLIAVAFSALGMCVAIASEKFEHVNFVPTFIITPLTFLGGVFYSITMLPQGLRSLTLANPIFYLVDSVRFALLGVHDADPYVGFIFVTGLCLSATVAAYIMLATGYKLRG